MCVRAGVVMCVLACLRHTAAAIGASVCACAGWECGCGWCWCCNVRVVLML